MISSWATSINLKKTLNKPEKGMETNPTKET